ncbi:MAG TPA: hypothetical protein PLK35_03935 [Candidatus Moranbacteria bacterium]|nr:hypothetical protein [Candidatus Moranbacteria bacterium]
MRQILAIFYRFWNFSKEKKVPAGLAFFVIIILSTFIGGFLVRYSSTMEFPFASSIKLEPKKNFATLEEKKKRPKPGPISMKVIKTKGCVADGILSGYGDNPNSMVKFIHQSNCRYLHRALETWLLAPDFDKADGFIDEIDRPDMVYGMFIAEALNKKSKLYFEDESRYFDFYKMCRPGSNNVWGEHTCKPSLNKKEYQKYVKYITRRAMDLGIQSFLFGQVFYQDSADMDETKMPEIIDYMRDYAKQIGIDIIIGAQTNNITDEKYLRLFDYIEGGVGIDGNGDIENGPCLSSKSSCWALLWHDNYASKANNVFLHLDWSAIIYDDMGIYARMDQDMRIKTVKNLYNFFTKKNMGFMVPMFAPLHRQNDGCYGPKKRFYSADDKYKCKDEDAINDILKNGN